MKTPVGCDIADSGVSSPRSLHGRMLIGRFPCSEPGTEPALLKYGPDEGNGPTARGGIGPRVTSISSSLRVPIELGGIRVPNESTRL